MQKKKTFKVVINEDEKMNCVINYACWLEHALAW